MTSYRLENTLGENGTVSRGICEVENGFLKNITEHTKIGADMKSDFNGNVLQLAPDTPVSMNLWGFTPDIFDELANEFEVFMNTADLMKDEFFIPFVVQSMITNGTTSVKVFESASRWYGITYREDMAAIKNKIVEDIKNGLYD